MNTNWSLDSEDGCWRILEIGVQHSKFRFRYYASTFVLFHNVEDTSRPLLFSDSEVVMTLTVYTVHGMRICVSWSTEHLNGKSWWANFGHMQEPEHPRKVFGLWESSHRKSHWEAFHSRDRPADVKYSWLVRGVELHVINFVASCMYMYSQQDYHLLSSRSRCRLLDVYCDSANEHMSAESWLQTAVSLLISWTLQYCNVLCLLHHIQVMNDFSEF